MQEILGIDKALQVSNYTTKLIEIKKRVKEIARIQKKLKMILLVLNNKSSCIEIKAQKA